MRWTTEGAGWFYVLALGLASACAADHGPSVSPSASTPPPPPPRVVKLPPLQKASDRFASEHFAQEASAEVWINDAAKPYPKVGAGYAPAAGAFVVEKLYRGRETAPFATYVMERVPSDGGSSWSFLALRPDGTVEEGGTHLCERCHGEAPDGRGVFGKAP